MSGPIKKDIEHNRTRLLEYLDNLPKLVPNVNAGLATEENVTRLDELKFKLHYEIHRIRNAVNALQKNKDDWSHFICKLPCEERIVEEASYDQWADEEDSFLATLIKGSEALDLLESTLYETEGLQARLLHPKRIGPVVVAEPSSFTTPKVEITGSRSTNMHMRLPKLQLPTYDGDPLKWSEFWDAFEASVHDQEIPQVQKFTYLIHNLKGKAYAALEGMAVTHANYEDAIDILKKRFGNPSVIKRSLYSQLRKIPAASGKTGDLRSTLEGIDRVCRQLKSLREDLNQPTLIALVLEKLPAGVLMEVGKFKSPDELWEMDQLREQLEKIVCIREEAIQIMQNSNSADHKTTRHYKPRQQTHASTEAFSIVASDDKPSGKELNKRRPCAFCEKDHFDDQCEKFDTPETRKGKLSEMKKCFRCLRPGHSSRNCSFNKPCAYCQGNHNRALCLRRRSGSNPVPPKPVPGLTPKKASKPPTDTSNITTLTHMVVEDKESSKDIQEKKEKDVLMSLSVSQQKPPEKREEIEEKRNVTLLIAKTLVCDQKKNKESAIEAHLFFDNGSQRSFITKALANKLKLVTKEEQTLSIHTFAAKKPQCMKTSVAQLGIILSDGTVKDIQANILPMLTGKIQRKPMKKEDLQFIKESTTHEWKDELPSKDEAIEPDILIGSDYFWEFLNAKENPTRCPSGLYLIPSTVGWLIGGKQDAGEKSSDYGSYPIMTSFGEKGEEGINSQKSAASTLKVEDYWNLESIGITDSPETKDDDVAYQQFKDNITFEKGRYHVKWPWKSESPQLPDNYWLCYNRLKSLAKRFREDQDLLMKYDEIIQDQLKKGIVEKVEVDTTSGPLQHYLPHHPVITPLKTTTKIRIVYDASAKSRKDSNSLNECLYRGPIMLPDLAGILMRFRKSPIALTTDIEKAFLQVGLQEEDRDVTRFLWLKNLEEPFSQENIQVYRFCRVTFGVISSPFLLSATLQHHLSQKGGSNASQLAKNMYVDNVLMGAENIEEAKAFYEETKQLFAQASMNVREWTSNAKEVRDYIQDEDKLKDTKTKVLGILWDTVQDTLQISISVPACEESPVTKRQVLQIIASTYDPLGMLAPLLVQAKVFFQRLWLEQYGWDDTLPEELCTEWQAITHDWRQHPSFVFPRELSQNPNSSNCQLLTFVDASKNAYAAAVYLRIENEGSTTTQLLFSKNRLAPKKGISIPRLELLGAIIGARAMKFVADQIEIPITKKILWSDSECVLHWLKSTKPLSTFVENRIKELRTHEDVHFRYIKTDENPADLSTRGVPAIDFDTQTLWWNGPKWLTTPMDKWPEWNLQEIQPHVLQQINEEAKGTTFFHEAALAVLEKNTSMKQKEERPMLIDASRISSWTKLTRVTVYCLRFLKRKIWNRLSKETQDNLQKKLDSVSWSEINDKGPISVKEMKTAETFTLHQVQENQFSDVIQILHRSDKKKHPLKDQLGVYLDENKLLRCRGRIEEASLDDGTKHPILLPRSHRVTELIVLHKHRQMMHGGVQQTLADVRKEYWVPKGRSEVRKIISQQCYTCRKYTARPFSLPPIPALPKERVQQSIPFEYTGLDYLGPLWVKEGGDKTKMWICLFTCLVTRAIHLEPVMDLTAQQFLNCVRRFIARRSRPRFIISDNAPQFKLVQKTMEKAWSSVLQDDTILTYFANQQITWRFITEYAPWQGGVYERMVGIVKQALRKAVGRQLLSTEQMNTLLAEVEGVVNSRPLTYLYDEIHSQKILRPIDFLLPKGEIGIPTLGEQDKNDQEWLPKVDSKEKLLQFWKKSLKNLDQFWKFWHEEYLLSLRERTQTMHHGPRSQAKIFPKIGEVVLLKEEGTPRGVWKLGKIVDVTRGRGNEIRSAKIQLPNQSFLKRPVNLLYPLELSGEEAPEIVTSNVVEKEETQEKTKDENQKKPRQNHQILHPRISSSAFYTMAAIMVILCFFPSGTQGRSCPENVPLTRIQSQNCIKEGFVIMKTDTGNLCWIKKKCLIGHLHEDGNCGPLCACPKWAEECSYYNGPSPKTKGDQASILNLAKPSACAFKPDSRCNEKPTHTRLHQIQLFDGSLHLVKNLELRRAEDTTEEFECQGEGPQVGTPEFCETHECAQSGTKFCYYRNNEIVFFVNEDGEIPIKAWGSIPVTIYGPKEIPPENPTCPECSLKCIQGGIEIILDDNMGLIEACSKPYCYRISHPKQKESVLFPKDVIINTHEVTVKIWSNGYMIKNFGTQCEASPYCEMIQCYLCWDLIGNPQCAPKWMLSVIFGLLYLGSCTIYLLIKILKYGCQCCYYLTYFSWNCLRFCRMLCRRARSKTYEKMYLPVYTMFQQEINEDQIEKGNMETRPLVVATKKPAKKLLYKPTTQLTMLSVIIPSILIISQVGTVETCAEVTVLSAQQSMCSVQDTGTMECVITEATRLALVPQGQESCLLIKDPTGQPIGTISVEVEKVTLECQIKNEYFTRSFVMKVASSKRCSGAGSCNGEKCGDVKTDSKIAELDGEANNSPGFTYCTESCGCAACGCFYCTSACLFYRTYASPASDTTYEVFSCPIWQYKVQVTIRLNLQTENTEQIFDLKPGVAVNWKNIKLTLTSVTSPPAPVLGSQFLTDGSKTILVKASASGQPVAGTVGELQCASREKASRFECYLPHDSCICQGQETRVACNCMERSIEKLFSKTDYLLPLTTQGLGLTGNGHKVEAEYKDIASLELQISMEGFRLSTKTEKNKCQIKPREMAGCYNCFTGAKLKFECKTDFGEALAHVTCGTGSFSTICTPQGVNAIATMKFPSAVIKETCTVVCPAGTTTFPIEATLVFIEQERLGTLSNVISITQGSNGIDLGFISAWLSGNWLAGLITVAAVVIIILLSVILFPIIMQILFACFARTSAVTALSLFSTKKQPERIKNL